MYVYIDVYIYTHTHTYNWFMIYIYEGFLTWGAPPVSSQIGSFCYWTPLISLDSRHFSQSHNNAAESLKRAPARTWDSPQTGMLHDQNTTFRVGLSWYMVIEILKLNGDRLIWNWCLWYRLAGNSSNWKFFIAWQKSARNGGFNLPQGPIPRHQASCTCRPSGQFFLRHNST